MPEKQTTLDRADSSDSDEGIPLVESEIVVGDYSPESSINDQAISVISGGPCAFFHGRRRYHHLLFSLLAIVISAAIYYQAFQNAMQVEEEASFHDEFYFANETFQFYEGRGHDKVDFRNAASPVPKEDYAALDNLTCLDQGVPEYPPAKTLIRRAPYAILLGVMKGGTTALSSYLYQHPKIVHPKGTKEIHFYDIEYDDEIAAKDGIHRKDARNAYRQAFRRALKENFRMLTRDKSLVAIDDSPRYLFWSDRVPARLLCVTPWAKLILILRNPVDRVYSHYTMLATSKNQLNKKSAKILSFEEYIHRDLQALRKLGVVRDWKNQSEFDAFAGSKAEMKAWRALTRAGGQAILARGMYALQLRHWFKALKDHGKERSDLLIVRNEDMRVDTDGVNRRVLEHLGLPYHELEDEAEVYTGHYHGNQMKNETRELLEKFYAPYNRHLYDMLGDDWEGVWDPK